MLAIMQMTMCLAKEERRVAGLSRPCPPQLTSPRRRLYHSGNSSSFDLFCWWRCKLISWIEASSRDQPEEKFKTSRPFNFEGAGHPQSQMRKPGPPDVPTVLPSALTMLAVTGLAPAGEAPIERLAFPGAAPVRG